jgi:hypothetical protein
MEEEHHGLFIPKKQRVPARRHQKQKRLKQGKDDIGQEALFSAEALRQQRDNVLVASFMAINLYLQPHIVFAASLYWIAEYATGDRRQRDDEVGWFCDHVSRLLAHSATFSLSSSRALSHTHSEQVKHNVLLRFAGSPLHKIPNEYFIVQRNQTLLEALVHFTSPAGQHAFLVREHEGLKGELEMDCFLYDRVLNFFYEPSFFVITAYLIYLSQLFWQSGGRDMAQDFAPVLERILLPLLQSQAAGGESHAGCLCRENSNFEEKARGFRDDLAALQRVLREGATSPEEMMRPLCELWCAKAEFCLGEQPRRYMAMHREVHGQ